MKVNRGWIVLDIDGTITDAAHRVPPEVIGYFHALYAQGWKFMFITGRTFSFAYRAMRELDFPFFLALQNGADILQMPERKLVIRHYLRPEIIPVLEEIYNRQKEDFLIYAGCEQGDFCYYRKERFSPKLLAHLQLLMTLSPEPWKEVADFHFSSNTRFPLIKCLGTEGAMEEIHRALQRVSGIATTVIRDPLAEGIYLNLVTASEATKGNALAQIVDRGGPVIAAGDDLNDISMLEEADIKIVLSSAPKIMHPLADILAEEGIIHALEEAIKHWD